MPGMSPGHRGDVVRLSFHDYNDTEDVIAVCEQISKYRPLRGPPGSPGNDQMGGGHVQS